MKHFLGALKRPVVRAIKNPQTTATGLIGLAVFGVAAAHDPAVLLDPKTVAGAVTSLGLIFSADAKNSAPPPTDPTAQ